jgi:hypothetical protein
VDIQIFFRRNGAGFAALLAAGLLSGCMGSPTYGTGTPAGEQLLQDVTGILSLAPDDEEPINYKPRPDLVTPAETGVLPPPQESVATASNPSWPESPEQRRARLRAEATATRDNPNFEPLVENDIAPSASPSYVTRSPDRGVAPVSTAQQRTEFNRRLAMSNQGSPTQRRFLSEPPIEYRQPAPTAPVDDVGEDEWKKQKRLKAEARKKAGKSGWADILPW